LHVSQIASSPQEVQVQIRSTVGHTYHLQHSDVIYPASWSDVGASQVGTGSVLTFTDDSAPTLPQGFYRFRVY